MATSEEAEAVNLDAIEGEILLLQRKLAGEEHIGFCHNDLQYGNIMMDEDTKAITIIVRYLLHPSFYSFQCRYVSLRCEY